MWIVFYSYKTDSFLLWMKQYYFSGTPFFHIIIVFSSFSKIWFIFIIYLLICGFFIPPSVLFRFVQVVYSLQVVLLYVSFQYSNEHSIVVVVGLFYITIFVFFVCFWNTMLITEAIALSNVILTHGFISIFEDLNSTSYIFR